MGFKLRPGTSVFGNVTFTPGTNENYVAPPVPPVSLPKNPLFILSQSDDTPEDGQINAGSVYVYNLDNLTEEPIIKRPITDGTSTYGSSAYRSSEYLFIGAKYLDEVYVYDVDDSNTSIMTLSSPTENIQFGNSLSGDENTLVVGSFHVNGFAYVYDMNDLSNDPIELSAPASGSYFGEHCLVLPSYIVVSHRGYNTTNYQMTGAFWVYDRNDLSASPTLVENPAGSFMYGQFAYSLSLSEDGSKFVVGSIKGSIYVYDSNNPSSAPVSEFLLTDELKDITSGGTDPSNSSTSNALSETHFVTSFSSWSGYDNNGDPMSVGKVYIWPADDPSATPTTLSGFDVGITKDGLGVPAWNPVFGTDVELVDDKLIVASVEGTSEMPDRPGTVRVFDINDLSSPLATFTQPYSEYVSHDLFGKGIYAPGLAPEPAPAPESAPAPEPAPAPAPVQTSARWVVVGSPGDEDNGSNSGSIYVYDANDLSVTPTKLTAFDGTASDQFGITTAVTSDKIVVGATNDLGQKGSVYVFDANNLSDTPTKLTAFDGAGQDFFGRSVVVTDDKIVIGAPNDDDRGTQSGSVYVYDVNNLSDTPTKLTAFDGAASDYFGYSVDATSDKIVVGAYRDDDNGSSSGAVYVFDANDLSAQPTKLTPFDGQMGDQFGWSVVVTDDKIVVGARYDDDNGSNSGSIYVYDANDLSAQPTKLTSLEDGITFYASDYFGYSVDATSDKIVVGAYGDDINGSNSGSAYVFDANDLSAQPTKLTAFDGDENDWFSRPVAAAFNTIVVSAYGNDDDGLNSGSVYVYDANDLSATPTKLTAFDGAADDQYGESVAIG